MPYAPAKPCKHPRCAALAQSGSAWCATHQPAARAEVASTRQALDAQRGSAHARGYDSTWAGVSRHMRALFPVSLGYLVPTTFWSPNLAHQFHTLRMAAQGAGQFLSFFQLSEFRQNEQNGLNGPDKGGSNIPAFHSVNSVKNSDLRGGAHRFLKEFPIYTWHASPHAEPAEVTDHIAPHRGDQTLFWAEWNLQPISKRQHDTKTATEDGGFRGRPSGPSSHG